MITIEQVLTKKQQKEFIDFPLKLYKGNPYYTPPLYMDEKKIFRNDFVYNDMCDSIHYNAYKDGKMAGRISGIVQRASNEKTGKKQVRFGHFDVIEDEEVARLLLKTVEDWAISKGMNEVIGPLGYSDLDREGLLIGGFDYPAIRAAIGPKTRLITIQRSKGYATRPSFSVDQIGELIAFCKGVKPDVLVMVDNCYGEFVEALEPTQVGADMAVGSLIKNPGGGLAPIGGYIVGKKQCIERCAYLLSAPGLGQEVGANLGILPSFYQGFFLAPTVVAGALKGAIFAANCFERLGFRVIPDGAEARHDIIQAVELGSEAGMRAFCKGIQAAAPVDSYVEPIPWAMPGYDSDVIMAAGAFVQGSSIELSADGPIRAPFAVYFQGGLTWYHAKLGILRALQELVNAGLVPEEAL